MKRSTVDELIEMSKKTNVVLYNRSDILILVIEIKRLKNKINNYEKNLDIFNNSLDKFVGG